MTMTYHDDQTLVSAAPGGVSYQQIMMAAARSWGELRQEHDECSALVSCSRQCPAATQRLDCIQKVFIFPTHPTYLYLLSLNRPCSEPECGVWPQHSLCQDIQEVPR